MFLRNQIKKSNLIRKSHRNFFHLDRFLISTIPLDALEPFLLALIKVTEYSIFFHFDVAGAISSERVNEFIFLTIICFGYQFIEKTQKIINLMVMKY